MAGAEQEGQALICPEAANAASAGSPPAQVLFASSSVGAGHNQAAVAVMAALAETAPSIDAEFTDALEFVDGWFRLVYAGVYTLGVTRFHRVYGLGYCLADRPRGPRRRLSERIRLAVEWFTTRRYRQMVLARRPVLVMATHYLAMPAIGRMIARGVEGIRLWAVITDNEAHRFWYAENVERYFAANRRVVDQLVGWGVDPDRITVSGIPVHPKWTAPVAKAEVLSRWRLPGDVPIVLLSGGTFFTVGPIERIARGILAGSRAHVVVLAGSNKKLLGRLAAMPEAPRRLTPVPFTDRAHELAEVASLMVTKAGGLTTAECVAKGLPMLLTRPVPGQEAANTELLVREGAALVADKPAEVVSCAADLLSDPGRLEHLGNNARRLYLPASGTIASQIAEAVER